MIRVHSHSEPGGHVVNEDAYRVVQHEGDDRCHMIVVADGQGGRSGGAAAAATACNSFIDQANAIRPKDLLLLSRWDELLGSVDLSVVQDPAAGYTTLVALCVFEGFLVGASSGDSAAMIHLPNEDRYFVLTERQQKNPPVGSGSAVFVPFSFRLEIPWRQLTMTDGCWKYAGWSTINESVKMEASERVIDSMLNSVRMANGELRDDFTAVLLED